MPDDFDKIIEFSVRFEQAHGYANYGLTGTSKFRKANGTVVSQPLAPTEAQAKNFYKKYFFSKSDGYDLEGLPQPLAVMGMDIAVNQYDVGGTLMIAANRAGANITAPNGAPFDKAQRDQLWANESEKVKNGTMRYQDTDLFKLYEQNKQKIIDAYNNNPQAFLQDTAQTRLEMYSRTPGRDKHSAEWSERAFANYNLASTLITQPDFPTNSFGPTFASNTLYSDFGANYTTALDPNNTTKNNGTAAWFTQVDATAVKGLNYLDNARTTTPIQPVAGTGTQEEDNSIGGFFKGLFHKLKSWLGSLDKGDGIFAMILQAIEKLFGFGSGGGQSNGKPPELKQADGNQKTAGVVSNVTPQQALDIEGTLSGLSTEQDAQKFTNVKGVTFLTPLNDPHLRVGIDVPNPDGTKTTRYFERVDSVDANNSPTGLKANAWIETKPDGTWLDQNGKHEIHLTFGGYTGSLNDGSNQTKSLKTVIGGGLNPQTTEAAIFTNRVIQEMGGKDKISGVIFGSHSLGAANALSAQTVCDVEGVKSETMLLAEPAAASRAKNQLQAAMLDPNSDFSQTLQSFGVTSQQVQAEAAQLDKDISDHTISIRALHGGKETLVATLDPRVGMMSAMRGARTVTGTEDKDNPDNAMLGKEFYLNFDKDKPLSLPGASQLASMDPYHPDYALISESLAKTNGLVTLSDVQYHGQGSGSTPKVSTSKNGVQK